MPLPTTRTNYLNTGNPLGSEPQDHICEGYCFWLFSHFFLSDSFKFDFYL